MAHEFTVSEFGLKLIKAYEGFRSVEATLVSGQRVIGYGHRPNPGDEGVLTEDKAEKLLLEDLRPYEEMINESVRAPLTQSQFDALLSLAYNIGPKAFLDCNTLHAINNGRPLDAASGFDEWRKSTIEGRTYVVDALVRRRTAEKALFLRPGKSAISSAVAAPRIELPPEADPRAEVQVSAADTEMFSSKDAENIVDRAPYDARPAEFRRKEDGPAGVLTLSEVVQTEAIEDETESIDEDMPVLELDDAIVTDEAFEDNFARTEQPLPESPIAAAAAEVSERLDRLIADNRESSRQRQARLDDAAKRDLAIAAQADAMNGGFDAENILPKGRDSRADTAKLTETRAANDGLDVDPAGLKANEEPTGAKPAVRGPDAYIQKTEQVQSRRTEPESSGAYWAALMTGGALLGGGAARMARGNMDELTAFLAPAAVIVGGMIVTGALYYLVKYMLRRPGA